jgi:hypothetical protein
MFGVRYHHLSLSSEKLTINLEQQPNPEPSKDKLDLSNIQM